jgi:hypothetical protein
MKMLIDAANRAGIVMLARIAVLRALNHDEPDPSVAPRRKRVKLYRLVK